MKAIAITDKQLELGKVHKELLEMIVGRKLTMRESYEIALTDSVRRRLDILPLMPPRLRLGEKK